MNHAEYVVGSGDDIAVAVGALLEILLAIAGIATAVVIFPIVKRVNESVALGYVASRTVESILILVGVVSLMSIVALRQDFTDAASNSGALTDVAGGLLAVHDQIALLGPQFCAGLGNGILLGYLMWRSRLLPRPLVMIGLIGGPLALLAGIGVLLGPGVSAPDFPSHSQRPRPSGSSRSVFGSSLKASGPRRSSPARR